MLKTVISGALLVLVGCAFAHETNETHTHGKLHSALLHKLLQGYDKLVAPNQGNAVHVNVSIYFNHLEWSENEVVAVSYVRMYWHDERFDATTKTRLEFESSNIAPHIWKPDLFAPNALSKRVFDTGFVRLDNGDVIWSEQWKLHVPCRATVRDLYMHDGRVNCSIELESYGSSNDKMNLAWHPQSALVDPAIESVKNTNSVHRVTTLLSGSFDRLAFEFEMQTMFKPDVLRFVANSAIKRFS